MFKRIFTATAAILAMGTVLGASSPAEAKRIEDIAYAGGDKIIHYKDANRVAQGKTRICLSNRTGQEKMMKWIRVLPQGRVNHIITRHARGLSAAEVAAAVGEMEALKTHPRDEAVNRFLIRRTERIYEELPLLKRDELGDLVHGFEEALEVGEPDPTGSKSDVTGFRGQRPVHR